MDANTEKMAFKLHQLMEKINECQKLIKTAYLMVPNHQGAMKAEFERVNELALQDARNGLKTETVNTSRTNVKRQTHTRISVHDVPDSVEEKVHGEEKDLHSAL